MIDRTPHARGLMRHAMPPQQNASGGAMILEQNPTHAI
jgi:hypothetical protein